MIEIVLKLTENHRNKAQKSNNGSLRHLHETEYVDNR